VVRHPLFVAQERARLFFFSSALPGVVEISQFRTNWQFIVDEVADDPVVVFVAQTGVPLSGQRF
jgi:hypothetical protein